MKIESIRIENFRSFKDEKENKALLNLLGEDEEMYWPKENKHLKKMTIWKTNITDTVASELGENLTLYRNQSSASENDNFDNEAIRNLFAPLIDD